MSKLISIIWLTDKFPWFNLTLNFSFPVKPKLSALYPSIKQHGNIPNYYWLYPFQLNCFYEFFQNFEQLQV